MLCIVALTSNAWPLHLLCTCVTCIRKHKLTQQARDALHPSHAGIVWPAFSLMFAHIVHQPLQLFSMLTPRSPAYLAILSLTQPSLSIPCLASQSMLYLTHTFPSLHTRPSQVSLLSLSGSHSLRCVSPLSACSTWQTASRSSTRSSSQCDAWPVAVSQRRVRKKRWRSCR